MKKTTRWNQSQKNLFLEWKIILFTKKSEQDQHAQFIKAEERVQSTLLQWYQLKNQDVLQLQTGSVSDINSGWFLIRPKNFDKGNRYRNHEKS